MMAGLNFVCGRLEGGDIVNSEEGVVVLAKADLGSIELLLDVVVGC